MADKLVIVRHGETEWTRTGQHTGVTDLPLEEEGREDAQRLKPILKSMTFNKVFTSPLKRASETCQIAGFGEQAEIDPDLVEWNYGKYEGLTSEEIKKLESGWNIFDCGAPDGESPAQIVKRAERVLKKMQKFDGSVLLFSSGHFLRSLTMCYLALDIKEGKHFALQPATISILGFEKENPALLLWNYKVKNPCF